MTPDGSTVYVAAASGITVSAIDAETNTLITDINVGVGPDGMAVTPDGQFVFVAKSIDQTVAKIDVASNTVAGTVGSFNGEPTVVSVTPDGERLYVATSSDSSGI